MNTHMKKNSGFTLIETITTVVILTIAAVGLMSFLTSIRFAAENNLYESTALTVALSTLEQMKSQTYQNLQNTMLANGFNLETGNDNQVPLSLTTPTTLPVPVVSDLGSANQAPPKLIPITLRPSITASATRAELWIEIQYSYEHPRNGRVITGVVRGTKNNIPTN